MKEIQRSPGLDVIRSLAIVFVVGGHFFLNTNFKRVEFGGFEMFVLAMGQTLFLTNVCLFMMLTGYLNIHKTVSKKFYKGGFRVIFSYLLLSLLTILFRKFYQHDDSTWLQWMLKITDFTAIPYAWYIEMWIGLFLLTPFLNILWKGVESIRHRQVLLASLFIMSALPDFTNRYGLYLMPGYWAKAAYPLLYFFLGCYVREYQPVLNRKWLGGAILLLCTLNPLFNTIFMSHHTMMQVIGGQGGIIIVPLTVLIFLMFYKLNVKWNILKTTLESISLLSLDMYLVSYTFDALCYPLVREHVFGGNTPFILTFVIVVPMVLFSSYCVAYLKSLFIK